MRLFYWRIMDLAKARTAYFQQKNNAKARGIEWQFTFETWVDWWGADIERRGSRVDSLQMQRIADAGPYHPDNVRKGVPKQNGETYSRMHKHRASRAARTTILRAEMDKPAVSAEPEEVATPEDQYHSSRYGLPRRYSVYGV